MTKAGPEHAAAMAAIHKLAFPHDPWSEAAFRSLLQQPGVTGLIDVRGGIVLVRSVLDEAEILTIGAAVPRQGIGRALMEAAIARLRTEKITTLHLEVSASNAAARCLYTRLGFKQAGLRRGYYPDGSDAVLLKLPLSLSDRI